MIPRSRTTVPGSQPSSGTNNPFAKSAFRSGGTVQQPMTTSHSRLGVRATLEIPRTRSVPASPSPTGGSPHSQSFGLSAAPSSTGYSSTGSMGSMSGISPVSATTSAMSPNEIGRPLSYLRERSPLGFLSLIADPPSSHEILYVNCPTKFVLEPDPCHWHDPPLGEYRIKQGQLLLKKFDKKLIAPLLNGFYLVFHMDSASVTLHKRQLAVVFDLDNTLVHSVETDHPALYARGADVHHLIFREPYEHQDSHVVTKVRPGAREVLKALQEKFSLYICTMGTKSYVTQALKVLDPDGTIFKHAICREDLPSLPDDPNVLVKDLYRIKVVQDPTWTLVVDDSPDVWVQKHGHVLPITKYYYFTDDYPVDSYRNAVPSLYSVRVVLESIHRQCIFGDKPWEVSMLQMLEKYHRS